MSKQNQRAEELDRSFYPSFLDKKFEKNHIPLKSKAFGDVIVSEKQIFDFPEGIPGFDFIKKFVFLQENNTPFMWMQAYDEPSLAFIIINPLSFLQDYKLMVSQNDMEAISAQSVDDVQVFAIVTIPENPSDMTANLQGPVILNLKNNEGMQAISLNDKYHVRHKILEEMKNNTDGGGR